MKTPREILLERHQKADEKLDAIRKTVMATALSHETQNANRESFLSSLNHQLSTLLCLRSRAWLALAPLWIIIFALKLSTHDASHFPAGKSSVSPAITAEVRQQKVFFAELIGVVDSHDADRPKTFSPRPRSELRFETAAV
jgi:hypothetical protein